MFKKSSSFTIDENILSFEIADLVDYVISENPPAPNYGGPNAFSPHTWSITLIMAEGTDITSLSPIITLAPGANLASRHTVVQDFSKQVDYTVITEDGSKVTYMFLAHNQEKTRGAIKASIFISPSGSGNTSPSGTYTYDENLTFSCTAFPLSGYQFERWQTSVASLSGKYHFNDNPIMEKFNANFNLTAYFVAGNQFVVSLESENTNRGTVSAGGSCYSGGTVYVSASPKPGWEFDGWSLNGTIIYLAPSFYYGPSSSCTLVAKFKLLPPSGSVSFCSSSSGTYSLPNPPSSYTWDKSSNLLFSGGSSGSSVTVIPNGSATGFGWVSVTYDGKVVKKDVWIGVPLQTATMEMNGTGSIGSYGVISDNISVCLGEMLSIKPILPPYVADEGIIEYDYAYSGTLLAFGFNNYGVCTFVVPYSAGSTFTIQYRRRNDCGWTTWNTIYGTVSNCSKSPSNPGKVFIAFPNPTNSTLFVEIDQNNTPQSKASNMVITYDIRLFNMQGNLLRSTQTKTGKVQFDVSNLPSGMYYLQISDEVSSNVEIHPIIIQ